MFDVILVIIQGWSSKGLRDAWKLLRHSKILSPPLSPTLEKPHNRVSLLTNFSKLNFEIEIILELFWGFQIISRDFELFWTLGKLGETKA